MGRHTTTCSKNSLGSMHAVDILWRGFNPNEDNFSAVLCKLFSLIRCKHNNPTSSSRRGRESFGNDIFHHTRIKRWVQQLVKLSRSNPQNCGIFINQPFSNHIHRYFNCSGSCPFTVTGLQHKQFPFFNGKLDILHIFIMLLQNGSNLCKLGVALWQYLFH